MELLYVWIEDYKNIKKQGFNFSPKHWFNFEYEEDESGKVIGGTLKHEDRSPNYLKDFFGENISNVTAIVGKNGSGKSNLLEFIISIFAESFKKNQFYALVFSDSNNRIIKHLSPNPLISSSYLELQKCLSRISTLYYSNIVTNRLNPDFLSNNNILDISTATIIDDKRLEDFYNEEVYNQINAGIHHKSSIEEYFKLPNELTIEVYNIILEYNSEENKLIKSYFNFIDSTKTQKTQDNKINQLSFFEDEEIHDPHNLLTLFNYKILKITFIYYPALEKYLKLIKPEPNFKILIKELLKLIEPAIQLELWSEVKKTEPIYKKYLKVISLFEDMIQESEDGLTPYSFKVNISSIQEFLIAYSSISSIPLCKIKWHNLSSGEIGILNLYSRFQLAKERLENDKSMICQLQKEYKERKESFVYEHFGYLESVYDLEEYYDPENEVYLKEDIIEDIFYDFENLKYDLDEYGMLIDEVERIENLAIKIKSIKESNNLLLLIDEGDLYFHPQWQKSFLLIIFNACSSIFNNYRIQLMLTTHSPFLLSDIPANNCIFINSKLDFDMAQCFGANIHSLYRNSFFIENGLMGEFARGKIDGVIKYITNSKSKFSKKKLKECRFIIEQIGEPVLRNKLEKTLTTRLKESLTKKEKFEELREKLEASLSPSELTEFIQNLKS